MIDGFNIRIYALCVEENRLLVLHEPFMGNMVCKLPGGGLEFGEGTIDCLKREFMEELGLKIKNYSPYYIQENYVESLAKNNKQIVLLYFKVEIENASSIQLLDTNIQSYEWIDLKKDCPLTLPVDQIVYEKLKKESFFLKRQ
jgi:8-oxo-dGTP diphosphatase